MADWTRVPRWKKLLFPFFVPFILITFAAVLVLLLPIALWNGLVWSGCWIRFKLTGIPIPPKGPVISDPTEGGA